MEVDIKSIVKRSLKDDEYAALPGHLVRKIDEYFDKEFGQYLTAKAVYETERQNSEQKIANLETQLQEALSKNESTKANLESANQHLSKFETQIEQYRGEVIKLNESLAKSEHDSAEFKRERDLSIDEKNNVQARLDRRNIEVERLQADVNQLSEQLQAALASKCDLLAQSEDVENKKITIEYREKRMEQERNLLNNEIKTLSNELYKRVNEITYLRRENTTRMATLQSALDIKIEELQNANDTIKSLTDSNNELTLKVETLVERLKEQRESEQRYHDSFAQELQSQTRVAELYKDISEESKIHIKTLNDAVSELQQMLTEAAGHYEELETKYNQEKESLTALITKKDENIEILKKEIEDANELLQIERDQRMEQFVETLSPSASAACKLIKHGTSLTQITSQLRNAEDEVQKKNLEIAQLKQYIGTICHELDDSTPMIVRQREEYEEVVRNNQNLLKNNEKLMQEVMDLQHNYTETKEALGKLEKELRNKNNIENDLAQQVRVLLKEISDLRAGSISNHENDSDTSVYHNSSDIISKKLVTFQSIEQLQINNQKLLGIVRELTQKTEEAEQIDYHAIAQLRNELESSRSYQQNLISQANVQSRTIDALNRQCNTYKTLYEQAMKRISNKDNTLSDTVDLVNCTDELEKKTSPKEKRASMNITSQSENNSILVPKEIEDLKKKLEDNEKIMKALKSDYENYQKEKTNNEKIIFEQLDALREENYSLSQKNCKLISANENKDEQLKISKSNIDSLKKIVENLEKKVNTSTSIIAKHEQTIKHLSDEVSSSQAKLSHYEVLLENIREENKMLKDIENRLLRERETLQAESQGQRLLLNNLESIKATFERSEAVGKIRLETRLDESTRECSALRRRLQEEQDRFRELSKHLEEEITNMSFQLQEKDKQISQLEENLSKSQTDLSEKIKQIENLSKKLNLSVNSIGNPFDEQMKSLEKELNEVRSKSQVLEEQLKLVKNQAVQYCELSERSEKQLLEHIEFHEKFKEATNSEIERRATIENTLTAQVSDLQNELSKYSNGENTSNNDLKNQNLKLLEQLANMEDEMKNLKIDFEASKLEISRLNTELQEIEEKYSREMIQHSTDIQTLASIREELQKFHQQRDELLQAKQDAIRNLESSKESWENREKLYIDEANQTKKRVEELENQNEILHTQLQVVTTQLAISSAQNKTDTNKSCGEELSTSLNQSFSEKDATTSEQLFQIIRFLRREKENINSKLEILQLENLRLNSQLTTTNKQLEEAKLAEATVRTKSSTDLTIINKHNDVLRRVETLNAVTDSNRVLREEREALVQKLNVANATISTLEEKIAPLQENNCELTQRIEMVQAEIASVKADAARWRQRANTLIERTNKTTPEEWRRLQTERDNLTKMLQTEKENIKKLNDLKIKYEQQINNLQRQIQFQNEQSKRNTEELNTLKQQNQKLMQDVNDLRETLNRSTENNNKLLADNENKGKEMKQLLSKYVSVRALARKYKEQAEEETRTAEQIASEPVPAETQEQYREEGRREANERVTTLEKSHNEKIKEFEAQIVTTQEEMAKLKKENEELRQIASSKYERSQALLRSAKDKIQSLNETNESLVQEISHLRGRLDKDTPNNGSSSLKEEYESKIARLEKEKNECFNERKQERDRNTRDIEALNAKVNQLQRMLSGQHSNSSKPSTSSGSTEKTTTSTPPTANIKPMAGQSQQQSASVTPRRKEDTPFASIRPMSVPSRTPAVATLFPSTTGAVSSCSTSNPTVAFPSQQVHTTGNNSTEVSSSPTSSQTEYMPATSSASSSSVTSLRQVVVPQARQSPVPGKVDQSPLAAESTQGMEVEIDSAQQGTSVSQQAAPQATVALVSPQQQADNETQQVAEQSTSSSDNNGDTKESTQLASSSSTVTTTHAGHKRLREATEGDSSTGNDSSEQDRSTLPQVKRSKVQDVSESGTTEPEYQVPTSSQWDQDDDVICVDSDDEDEEEVEDVDEEETEEEEEDDDDDEEEEDDDEDEVEEDDVDEADVVDEADEAEEMEEPDEGEEGPYEEDADEGYEAYKDGDCQEIEEDVEEEEEEEETDNNEVEIIEITESPNQQSGNTGSQGNRDVEENDQGLSEMVQSSQSQAVSSASSSEGAAASSSSFSFRGRNVSRQSQQMVIGHQTGFEEHGDDGIVPSTPTLFVPRRTDGFGETVNSPHVPSSGRFTFNEPPPSTSNRTENMEQNQEETNDPQSEQLESGTDRSVPTTPHQVSPESDIPQNTDNQNDKSSEIIISEVKSLNENSIPKKELDENLAGPSVESPQPRKSSNDECSDGVSSEGEKLVSVENSEMEEGCEAEASQSPSSNELVHGKNS